VLLRFMVQCVVYVLQERISILMNMLPLNWYAIFLIIYFLYEAVAYCQICIADTCDELSLVSLYYVAADCLVNCGHGFNFYNNLLIINV